MKMTKTLAAAAFAAMALAAPATYAQGMDPNWDKFVKMCDTDKDGMVSKAEVMKMMERAFDKADAKKAGKLDKKQTELFLKMIMDGSMGG